MVGKLYYREARKIWCELGELSWNEMRWGVLRVARKS